MDETQRHTVTIGLSSLDEMRHRTSAAFNGEPQGDHIAFASVSLLWKLMTAKRWEILQAMTGQGALAIREIARRTERDVKAVHADVHALLKADILRRSADGRIIFPYDGVHVDFTLMAA